MAVDAHMIHRCTIERATIQENALHEDVPVWTAWAEEVPCRLVAKRQRQFVSELAQFATTTGYVLLLSPAYGAQVEEGDRITSVVYEDGSEEPGEFIVRSVLTRRGRASRHVSLELERFS